MIAFLKAVINGINGCGRSFTTAYDHYIAVAIGKENHILRETLNALDAQLDLEKFLRVSRSAIVNLDRVKELQPMFKGENTLKPAGFFSRA